MNIRPDSGLVTLATLVALTAATPSRGEGDTCADPVIIGGIPFADARTTCAYADDYAEACPAADSSPDVVYEFTPTVDMCVDVRLCDSFELFDFKLYVYSEDAGCPAAGAGDTVLDIECDDDGCDPHPHILGLQLETLKTYWFVVDSPGDNQCGTYQLEITPCPVVGGGVFNRGIDEMTLEPVDAGLWRANIHWYAEADSTPTSLDFDFDLEITVNDDVIEVIPEDLIFEPFPIDYPCRTVPCSIDECGTYFRFGEEVAAFCLILRLEPEDQCFCSGAMSRLTSPMQLAPGDVVRARIVPSSGAIPEEITADDAFEATCCGPVGLEPTSWGEIKSVFR
jgi:hypothetical protein